MNNYQIINQQYQPLILTKHFKRLIKRFFKFIIRILKRLTMANNSAMDSTLLQDVTRSVDQLCSQMSINNINVPRIDHTRDVYEFINEYEVATATLPESSKVKLLVKAFPPGRFRDWYEDMIKTASITSTWKDYKQLIIKRYANDEDQDRHLRKLQEMKFVDNSQQKLFDYVEELLFCFKKAFPEITDNKTKIRYVKSNLGTDIQPSLSLISDYNNSKDITEFMRGIRQFDSMKPKLVKPAEKVQSDELMNTIKELVKEVKLDRESTRNMVAALQPRAQSPSRSNQPARYSSNNHGREESPRRPTQHNNRERSISPYNSGFNRRSDSPRRNYIDQNQYNQQLNHQGSNQDRYKNFDYHQSRSTDRSRYDQHQRSGSPRPGSSNQGNNYMSNYSNNQQVQQPRSNMAKQDLKPFDESYGHHYYQKFGVPPSPCSNCNMMHWIRHCHNSLN